MQPTISLPSDCGNAPRIAIVGDFVTSWARGQTSAVEQWLASDVTWTLISQPASASHSDQPSLPPDFSLSRLEVSSIITHGRLASCDGYLASDAVRLDFSHVFHFASTAKTAKIAVARTYLVESRGAG